MSDYDYCEKHDTSFLMPELLMCPKCAVERLRAGAVDEPIGDALIEAFDTIEKQARASDAQAEKLAGLLREALRDLHYLNNIDGEDRDLPDRITEALAAYDAERKSIPQVDQAVDMWFASALMDGLVSRQASNPEVSGPPSGGSTAPRCSTAAEIAK